MYLFITGNKVHRVSIIAMLCVIICSSSCTSHKDQKRDKNVFYLNLPSGYLESLDPAFSKTLYMNWMTHMLYNTLVETDEHLHITPSLATRWDISPDGLTYTFHLRNDIFFQDNPLFANVAGRKMVAGDVVYSFNRLMDPLTASPGAWVFNEKVAAQNPFTAIDDSTVQIKLLHPFRPLIFMLSMSYCSIVPKEVASHWGKDFRSHPCGTGPFTFRYWDEGNILILHRNDHYWEHDSAGVQLPYLKAIQISFIDSRATEFLLFLQGKIDFINSIDGSFKDLILTKNGELKKEYAGKFRLDKGLYLNTEYIGFLTDTANPLMDGEATRNVLVRQAINYAINRKKIVTYFKNGLGMPATAGFIPAGMPGFDSAATFGYTYDPAKALQLLAQAGYPNGRGLRPIKIQVQDNYVDIVNFVATELQNIGIPVQIEVIQPNLLKQEMSRSQAIAFRAQWIADYPDAETYLAFFNSHFPAPPNYTRFSNTTFDKWYDESMSLPDSARWQMYRKMDSLATSYAPVIPLYYDEILHFTRNNISGLRTNPMNIIDLKRVRIN